MPQATLLVLQGPDQGTRFQVGTDSVKLGRGIHNEVRLLDTEVSRQHAEIAFDGDRFEVIDRNSSNGTFVNGTKVTNAGLQTGDRLRVGRSVLLFSRPQEDKEEEDPQGRVDLVGQRTVDDRSHIVESLSRSAAEATMTAGPDADDRASRMLRVLDRVSEVLTGPGASEKVILKRVLLLTIESVGADRGCVLMTDGEPDQLLPKVYADGRNDLSKQELARRGKMPLSRSIIDYVVKRRQGVRTTDAQTDSRFNAAKSVLQAGINEALCVPLEGRAELLGVIYLDTSRLLSDSDSALSKGHFTENDLRLLIAVARQTAMAVESNRYQRALLTAERFAAMGQTIAMLSHHIKNILQGMKGGAYLVDMGLDQAKTDVVRQGWQIVEKNQDKIYHLVMDMLSFSKDRQPALELCDINRIVGEICELQALRAEEDGIRVEFSPEDRLPETMFDPEGLHRAVLNIVGNAVDALVDIDGGAVIVQTGYERDSNTYFVSVADNGPGIPDSQVGKIFNLFESSKGSKGTGLGLAVSRKVLREHGGDITVQSEVGRGSRFLLSWPKIEEEQPRLRDHGTQSG